MKKKEDENLMTRLQKRSVVEILPEVPDAGFYLTPKIAPFDISDFPF